MLETNEKYMSQKKLDSILSNEPPSYKPTQKELNTMVEYDDDYLDTLFYLAWAIYGAAKDQSFHKRFNSQVDASLKMLHIGDARQCVNKLNELHGRTPPERNPEVLRPLNMGDFKSRIFKIQHLLNEIKRCGGCPDYMKTFLEDFKSFYRDIKEPTIIG